MRWQVGLYGLRFDRDEYNELNVDTLGAVPSTCNRIDGPDTPQPTAVFGHQDFQTTSYAVFGSIQYDITDRLRLNVAGRYDDEERKYREATPDEINPFSGTSYNLCVQLTGLLVGECEDSKKFNEFEPKVSLSYDITPDVSTYVSYGEGFKSGGFNPKGSRQALIDATEAAGLLTDNIYLQDQYDKEVSKSRELGAKLRLLDRRLSINAAVFDTTIDGAQQFQFILMVRPADDDQRRQSEEQGLRLRLRGALAGRRRAVRRLRLHRCDGRQVQRQPGRRGQ